MWLAAVLACGPDAALAGRAAAALWDISRFEVTSVRVLAPARRPGLRGIDLRLATDLPEGCTLRGSIPVLGVPRLLLDLARDLTPWQLANVLHEAAFRRVLDRDAADDVLAMHRGARGMRSLREAIAMHDEGSAGTMSVLEDEFLRIVTTARLPLPEVNVVVVTPGGRMRVDFLWRRRRLCIETDGRASHSRVASRIDDAIRDEHLTAAGYRVERFTSGAIFGNPIAVASRLARLLERRTSSGER